MMKTVEMRNFIAIQGETKRDAIINKENGEIFKMHPSTFDREENTGINMGRKRTTRHW